MKRMPAIKRSTAEILSSSFKFTCLLLQTNWIHIFEILELSQYSRFHSPQLCKPPKSPDRCIPWICFFIQIIKHLMAMIRTEGNRQLSFLHECNYFVNDSIYIHIPFQVIIFEKITPFISPGASQMQK